MSPVKGISALMRDMVPDGDWPLYSRHLIFFLIGRVLFTLPWLLRHQIIHNSCVLSQNVTTKKKKTRQIS